jgi:hypothetical protein
MYLNKMAFFVTISQDLLFGTTELIKNLKKETLIKAIRNVLNTYQERGFKVSHFLMDGQFDSLRYTLSGLGINLNIVARHMSMCQKLKGTSELSRREYVVSTTPYRSLQCPIE